MDHFSAPSTESCCSGIQLREVDTRFAGRIVQLTEHNVALGGEKPNEMRVVESGSLLELKLFHAVELNTIGGAEKGGDGTFESMKMQRDGVRAALRRLNDGHSAKKAQRRLDEILAEGEEAQRTNWLYEGLLEDMEKEIDKLQHKPKFKKVAARAAKTK